MCCNPFEAFGVIGIVFPDFVTNSCCNRRCGCNCNNNSNSNNSNSNNSNSCNCCNRCNNG